MKGMIIFFLILFLGLLGYFAYILGIWDNQIKPKVVDFLELREQTGQTFTDSIVNAREGKFPVEETKEEITQIEEEQKMQQELYKQQQDNLAKMRAEIESLLNYEEEDLGDNAKKLAKVYEAMEPGDVAQVAMNLDEKLFIQILTNMKARNAGEVLSEITRLDPLKAASLSRMMVKAKN